MIYRASSVKAALEKMEKRGGLTCNGLEDLICPATHLVLENGKDGRSCYDVAPDKCPSAVKKNCKRVVHIYNDRSKKRLYSTLHFYYTLSAKSRDGFIDADDHPLGALIRKGNISPDELDPIEP